jgi:hypothetical protein
MQVKEEVIFCDKTALDPLGHPNKALDFQVNSAAVVSADNIAISETPLVNSPTKKDSTSDPVEPQNLNQVG